MPLLIDSLHKASDISSDSITDEHVEQVINRTHKTAKVKRWFPRHPEYLLHFVPTYSSWLNPVERFFAAITENRIHCGSFRSVKSLEQAITEYLENHNKIRRLLFGLLPQKRFWSALPKFVNEFLTQDSRAFSHPVS